ncbi:MAG TPA: MEDS domain-containing protein [Gemmatimonadaceae bacterium]
MTKRRTRSTEGAIDLGLRGEKVHLGDHIAYLWEKDTEFEEAVGFLLYGLRKREHVVVFGHDDANARVLEVLKRKKVDVDKARSSGKLSVLSGSPHGDDMLADIGNTFQRAVDQGSKCIRLLGNIGWARSGWPADVDILSFEAKVTSAAKEFPCVVMCMYDVASLSGGVMMHGAFETHPVTISRNILRENPYYVRVEDFLNSLEEMENRAKQRHLKRRTLDDTAFRGTIRTTDDTLTL